MDRMLRLDLAALGEGYGSEGLEGMVAKELASDFIFQIVDWFWTRLWSLLSGGPRRRCVVGSSCRRCFGREWEWWVLEDGSEPRWALLDVVCAEET